MKENQNQESRILKDVSKNGKDRRWRERKLNSLELGERLETLHYRNAERVQHCAEVLRFLEQTDGTNKLYQAYFCKNKLCALCNWRRSLKYGYQAEQVVSKALEEYPKGRFLFLTLTVKNVSGEKLNQTLSKITEGFRRLMMYKVVDKNMIGFLRATEVTYSKEREDYHPHLHVLLFVRPGYFKGGNYLSQEDWTGLWQKAMKLDYSPRIDIRTVKDTKGKGLKGAILETAKYPVKPFDESGNYSQEEKLQITEDMMQGLHRKRQIGFGKLFKEIKKQLDLDDLEDGDLVHTTEEENDVSAGTKIVAIWNATKQNYFIK